MSRELGAEALGVYQIALSFFYVFATVVSSGIPVVISHLSAKYKVTKDKNAEGSAVCASLVIGFATSLLLIVLIFCFKNLVTKATTTECFSIIVSLSPSIFFTAIYMSFRGALWGKQKHIANCVAEICEQLLRFALFLFFLTTAPSPMKGAVRAGACYSVSCMASMAFAIIYYFKTGGVLKSPKGYFKKILKSSLPITIMRLVSSILQPLIAIIIPFELQCAGYTESEAIGLFGIVTGMTLPLLSLPSTLIGSYSTALVPEISTSIAKNDKSELKKQIETALSLTMFLCFCFVPIYIGMGQEIGSFLFNNATSGYLLTKACFVMIPTGINDISQSILSSIDLESKTFKNYLIGNAFLIVSLFVLPRWFGIDAMILGSGISITISCILNVRLIEKQIDASGLVLKPLALMSIFSVACGMLGKSITNLLKCLLPQFFTLALSCLATLICFVLLCLIFDIISIKTIFDSLKKFKETKILKKKSKEHI